MAVDLNLGVISARSQISAAQLCRTSIGTKFVSRLSQTVHEMGSVRTFDSSTTLTVCEGYDVTKQEHYFKKRCSCCDCCHRRCTFRVWQVLLFLFVIAVIIAGLALIIAFFEDGTIATKLCAIKKADSPGDTGKHVSLVRR